MIGKGERVDAPKYLEYIRSLPCARCEAPPRSEAHHWSPRGAMGAKADDPRTVPLCFTCHRHFHDHGSLPDLTPGLTRELFRDHQIEQLIAYFFHRPETF